eukprot:1211304-Rhodomonas_salina.3
MQGKACAVRNQKTRQRNRRPKVGTLSGAPNLFRIAGRTSMSAGGAPWAMRSAKRTEVKAGA